MMRALTKMLHSTSHPSDSPPLHPQPQQQQPKQQQKQKQQKQQQQQQQAKRRHSRLVKSVAMDDDIHIPTRHYSKGVGYLTARARTKDDFPSARSHAATVSGRPVPPLSPLSISSSSASSCGSYTAQPSPLHLSPEIVNALNATQPHRKDDSTRNFSHSMAIHSSRVTLQLPLHRHTQHDASSASPYHSFNSDVSMHSHTISHGMNHHQSINSIVSMITSNTSQQRDDDSTNASRDGTPGTSTTATASTTPRQAGENGERITIPTLALNGVAPGTTTEKPQPMIIDIGPAADAALASFSLFTPQQLDTWAYTLYTHLDIRDRKHHFKVYKSCFYGKDAIAVLCTFHNTDERQALIMCDQLLRAHYFRRAESDLSKSLHALTNDTQHILKEGFKQHHHAFYQFTTRMTRVMAEHAPNCNIPAIASTPSHKSQSSNSSPSHNNMYHSPTIAPVENVKQVEPAFEQGPRVWRGWLDKKRDKGMKGWQRRYFVLSLDDEAISYHRSSIDKFPLGFIPLKEVILCQLLPDKKRNPRFDIVVPHRIFSLQADSMDQANQWVLAITQAVLASHQQKQRKLPKPPTPRTPLSMKAFWDANPFTHHQTHKISKLKQTFFQLNFSLDQLCSDDYFDRLVADFSDDAAILASLYDVIIHKPDMNGIIPLHPEHKPIQDNEQRERKASEYVWSKPLISQTTPLSRPVSMSKSSSMQSLHQQPPNPYHTVNGTGHALHQRSALDEILDGDNNTSAPTSSRAPATSIVGASGTSTAPPTAAPRHITRHKRSGSDMADITIGSSLRFNPNRRSSHGLTVEPRTSPSYGPAQPNGLPPSHPSPSTPTHHHTNSQSFQLSSNDRANTLLRFDLFKLASSRSNIESYTGITNVRQRIYLWLHSDTCLDVFDKSICGYRLALPLVWSILQSKHHEKEDDDLFAPQTQSRDDSFYKAHFRYTNNNSTATSRGASVPASRSATPTPTSSSPQSTLSPKTAQHLLNVTRSTSASASNKTNNRSTTPSPRESTTTRQHAYTVKQSHSTPHNIRFNTSHESSSTRSIVRKSLHWRTRYDPTCAACRESSMEFANFMARQCAGPHFNLALSNALLAILVTPVDSFHFIDDLKCEQFNVFNKPVVNDGVWLALFRCLDRSPHHIRRHVLRDITGILVSSSSGFSNCESLIQWNEWQEHVLPLCDDIPKDTNDRLLEKIRQYVLNLFSILHFHAFMSRDDFCDVLRTSFQKALVHNHSEDDYSIPRSMLLTMIARLTIKCKTRNSFMDTRWSSLSFLVDLIRAFIFSLPLDDLTPSYDPRANPLSTPHTQVNLHWREGLKEDRDLVLRMLDFLKALKLYTDMDAFDLSQTKQNDIKSYIRSESQKKLVDNKNHGINSRQFLESKMKINSNNMTLSPEFQALSEQEQAWVKKVQRQITFFKDTTVFLAMMSSRAQYLTQQQICGLVHEFMALKKREKVFNSKFETVDSLVKDV